ncbi:restriction endonuclease [Streptomyces boncukensis]|uniref:Restriction endonuclease n=1 Tax=Streptomyces boncukensis TaxID=2711219 RepID=A0A6G4XAG9_9ACTN|nr:restriction endonuclease [Streptomyces boncukensis]NGO73837.1 restriction endonuclease [Streptomyces boncukensis]
MPNSGESFESYIQFVYQTLLNNKGENISVARRATVMDNHGNTYNIDVFYEFDVAGVHHRVAIECKDTRRPVERDEAIAFAGKIRDLPSTIGIFISKSGFQRAAKKYLEDHGIVHYSGGDLPHLGQVVASVVSSIALPSQSATGQPFWTLLGNNNGDPDGTWRMIPLQSESGEQVGAFPLFFSKPQAEAFRAQYAPEACVRGVEQGMLRFLALCANSENRPFVVFHPVPTDDGVRLAPEAWTPRDLASEFSTEDISAKMEGSQ